MKHDIKNQQSKIKMTEVCTFCLFLDVFSGNHDFSHSSNLKMEIAMYSKPPYLL